MYVSKYIFEFGFNNDTIILYQVAIDSTEMNSKLIL